MNFNFSTGDRKIGENDKKTAGGKFARSSRTIAFPCYRKL